MKITIATIFVFLCLIVFQTAPRADDAPVSTSGKSLDEIADILKKRLQNQRQLEEQKQSVESVEKKEVLYKYMDEYGQWHVVSDIQSVPEKYRRKVVEIPKQKSQTTNTGTQQSTDAEDRKSVV